MQSIRRPLRMPEIALQWVYLIMIVQQEAFGSTTVNTTLVRALSQHWSLWPVAGETRTGRSQTHLAHPQQSTAFSPS